MGILDKIMFWKKKDEFENIGLGDKENLAFGEDFGLQGQGVGQQPSPGFGQPQPPAPGTLPQAQYPTPQYQAPRFETPQQDINSKNLEIISSKIDALRASLESINQRLANIETMARGEEEQKRRRYY